MSKLQKVLIVGGGFSGMSAGIQLLRAGVKVELIEKNPNWKAYGAGISIGGATLRALETLGLLDAFMQRGAATDGVNMFNGDGSFIAQLQTPPVEGSNVSSSGAVMRPALGDIMAERYVALGGGVRVGCTFSSLTDNGTGVAVTFSDGTRNDYDLVIGADGLFSQTRTTLFPDAPKPAYSGQGVWRAVLKRPESINTTTMWMDPATKLKVGVNPVSSTEVYLFLTDTRPTNEFIEPSLQLGMLKDLLGAFSDPVIQGFREELNEDSQVLYRPLEGMLLPLPWHQGNVVLIGDAVHATTPHLAMGAGLGIEDGIVLADELINNTVAEALEKFEQRRWERCRMVVHNSYRLGEIEINGGDKFEHSKIMQDSLQALTKAI